MLSSTPLEEELMRRPIYDYTYLALPFDEACRLLGEDPTAWLPEPTRSTGGSFTVELDDGDGHTVEADVSVGEPRGDGRSNTYLRPITWEAAVTPGLFPRMTAELELSALSRDRTQLTFVGTYRPPATVVGDVVDRMAGHRIAESVVRTFLLSVAARLTQGSPTLAR